MWRQLEDTFNNKKVFVTGHTGFMGGWLTQTLQLLGADVMGYSLSPYYENSLYELLDLENSCTSVIADIRDEQTLKQNIVKHQPDFVFHLAAQPLVRASYKVPIETFGSNLMGTVNVLDAIRLIEKPVTSIFITTDKVYENKEKGVPFVEADRLGGYDPYSASKACCEIAISSYVNSFFNIDSYKEHGKAIASCRAGNVIGGGDWATDRLVPDIVRALKVGEQIEIRSPKAIRPWQHVLEPVFFYLLLAKKLEAQPEYFAGGWNIGPQESDILTVLEVVEKAIKIWGSGKYKAHVDPNAVHEAGILKLDCTKAQKVLQWKPQLDVDGALSKTIEWYKLHHESPNKSAAFTKAQIVDYANLLQLDKTIITKAL